MDKKYILACTIVLFVALAPLFFLISCSPNNNHPTNCHDNQQNEIYHSEPGAEWEGKFNFTNKIVNIFPEIDVDPTDEFVSVQELTQWNLQHVQREVLHSNQREMVIYDKNYDGFVSFTEYRPPSSVQLQYQDEDSCCHDTSRLEEEHFNASDADGDGLLNLAEFNDFLHPADSNSPKVQQWLCKAEVRERDTDRDGKVSFTDFFDVLCDLLKYNDVEGDNYQHDADSMDASAEVLFSQLDKDGDGYLSDSDLLPIIAELHPSGHYYARKQAEYLISQTEIEKDGRLNLTEMIKSAYIYYDTIFYDGEDEFAYSHQEFF